MAINASLRAVFSKTKPEDIIDWLKIFFYILHSGKKFRWLYVIMIYNNTIIQRLNRICVRFLFAFDFFFSLFAWVTDLVFQCKRTVNGQTSYKVRITIGNNGRCVCKHEH